MRPSTSTRRFNLGDLTIVVVASAIFLALARYSYRRVFQGLPPVPPLSLEVLASIWSLPSTQFAMVEIVGTGLVLAGVASLGLRARRPRPRWRRLIRQPGWVAGWASLVAATAAIVDHAVRCGQELRWGLNNWDEVRETMYPLGPLAFRVTICPPSTPHFVSLAIVVAWGLLAASGRWRAERSWPDRLGCLLALGWFGLLAAVVSLDLRR